jgi:nucleoid-associated protein YgaU
MKHLPWLVIFSLVLVACSGPKSQSTSDEAPQIEVSESDEFAEPSVADEEAPAADPEVVSDTAEDTSDSAASPVSETESTVADSGVDSSAEPLVSESSLENQITPGSESAVQTNPPGTIKQYTVGKNETLMMIAFKVYGDYSRWRELASKNTDSLKGSMTVREGMVLSYDAPAEEFVWNPQGNPYLIKTGDTLGTISKEVYSDMKKWKLIWENNKPLIKDPNKIYAGFTIYYLENGREVASQF